MSSRPQGQAADVDGAAEVHHRQGLGQHADRCPGRRCDRHVGRDDLDERGDQPGLVGRRRREQRVDAADGLGQVPDAYPGTARSGRRKITLRCPESIVVSSSVPASVGRGRVVQRGQVAAAGVVGVRGYGHVPPRKWEMCGSAGRPDRRLVGHLHVHRCVGDRVRRLRQRVRHDQQDPVAGLDVVDVEDELRITRVRPVETAQADDDVDAGVHDDPRVHRDAAGVIGYRIRSTFSGSASVPTEPAGAYTSSWLVTTRLAAVVVIEPNRLTSRVSPSGLLMTAGDLQARRPSGCAARCRRRWPCPAPRRGSNCRVAV